MPEPPPGLTEEDQARLNRVQTQATAAATAEATMPPGEESVSSARAAVTEPEAETEARAQAEVVGDLDERPPPSPEIEELCQRIYAVIRAKRPPDEESLVKANPEEMAREAGGELGTSVNQQTQGVEGSYDALEQPVQGQPAQQPQPLETPPETVETPEIGASAAAPSPVPEESVSLNADVAANEARLEEAGMNSEAASQVQSGPIAEARAAQGELAEMAERDPALVLAEQATSIAQAGEDMAALQARAEEALQTARGATVTNVAGQQTGMVGTEEQMRARAGQQMQAIYDEAQAQVDHLLEPLPRTAMARWDTGIASLSTTFKSRLKKVEDWIKERHGGGWGAVVSAWDWLTGLPDWVTEEYDSAEKAFGDGTCALIRDISRDVNAVIATCEGLIETARDRIDAVVQSLPEGLREWAQGEQTRLGERLEGLKAKATEARDGFNRDLVERASSAVQEVRQQIHGLRQAAGGLVGRIADAVNRFLEDPAKFIIEGLLELVGISPPAFWAVVARIQSVIHDIAEDPLTFAGNLLAAVGQGFQQFFDNIGTHLLQGILNWLFSKLGEVGVTLPPDLSLKSVVTLFLQVMGITWPRIRKLLAKHIGEENVALIERAWEVVSVLLQQGPEGLFELLKDKLNPEMILDQVLDAVIDYVTEAVITRVTARILLLFNPVGAIVQAIEAIYRVLKWIFQNAAKIFSLIETVVNGAAALLKGDIGGMANAVEQALVKLIGPVLGFLADYVGLGGIPEAIKDAIQGLQKGVEEILDQVIGWLAEQGRKLLRALGLGGKEEEPGAGDNELGETVRFSAQGESHRMWVSVEGTSATLMVASTPMTLEERLENWNSRLETLDDKIPVPESSHGQPRRQRAENLLIQAGMLLREADTTADSLAQQSREATMSGTAPTQPVNDDPLEAHERQLASVVSELFSLFGDKPDQGALTDRFRRELAQVHPQGREQRDDALQALTQAPAGGGGGTGGAGAASTITSWDALVAALSDTEPAKRAVTNPLTQNHTFGKYTHSAQAIPQLQRAIQAAKAENPPLPGVADAEGDEAEWLRSRKETLNKGQHPYALAKAALNQEFFNGALEPQADAELRSAFFEVLRKAPPPVAPDLKEAFSSPSTTVNNLIVVIRGGTVGKVNLARLNALWGDPETGSANRTFLAGRLRDATESQHEWVPVSRLIDMVNKDAQLPTAEGMINPCRWIKLQHLLRVDTADIIFKPSKALRTATYEKKTYAVLQGHPGAIRVDAPGAKAWEQDGEGTFHHELFDIITAAMGRNATIEELIADLKAKCAEWVWNGELPATDLHPQLTLRDGTLVVDELDEVIAAQQGKLNEMLRSFDTILARVAAFGP